MAEGYDVVGIDIERHVYGEQKYPAQLVLQDVLTLHGSQFRDAAVIVASPPCQAYSYMAMPWSRAKAMAADIRSDATGQKLRELTALFDACFRIQREAIAASTCDACFGSGCVLSVSNKCNYCVGSGRRYIPMVVENVKGAQPWVGRAAWHYGSFYLWGDVPALMPVTRLLARSNISHNNDLTKIGGSKGDDWFVHHNTQEFFDRAGMKNARNWWSDGAGNLSATTSSHSAARKAASAQIAKIPFALASHIARVYHPGILEVA